MSGTAITTEWKLSALVNAANEVVGLVFAIPNAPAGGYTGLVQGWALPIDDVIEHCRRALPFAAAPKRVDFVDELPRTATGKLVKRILADRYRNAEQNPDRG